MPKSDKFKQPDPNRYSRAPQDILCDDRLSSSTKCVMFYMGSRCFGSPHIHMTQKEMMDALSMHKRTVTKAIHELEECGHITIVVERGRGYYRLNSPVYSYRFSNG